MYPQAKVYGHNDLVQNLAHALMHSKSTSGSATTKWIKEQTDF